jgi:hypothetical protein
MSAASDVRWSVTRRGAKLVVGLSFKEDSRDHEYILELEPCHGRVFQLLAAMEPKLHLAEQVAG